MIFSLDLWPDLISIAVVDIAKYFAIFLMISLFA